jgi:Fic family protein
MLEGVVQTAQESIELVKGITKIMQQHKQRLRRDLPNIYSQDLVNNLFRHPYTKVEFLMQELGVSRITATKYLDLLVQNGFLEKRKIGRSAFYINITLWELFIKNKTNV